jgi:hypothetical protein
MGALVSGAGAWVTWGRSVVTEPEVIELIETRSPYLYEQQLLKHQIQELRNDVKELSDMVKTYFEGNANGPPREDGSYR